MILVNAWALESLVWIQILPPSFTPGSDLGQVLYATSPPPFPSL